MKKGLLVRVGVDSAYGGWNSPVNAETGDFVFIPIPENEKFELKNGQNFPYIDFRKNLQKFSQDNNLLNANEIILPYNLLNLNTHLDPDFNYLTYGDNGKRRGKELRHKFEEGDFIVFYAGMRPIKKFDDPLYYGIIGFYEIQRVLEAKEIAQKDSIVNAHTRKKNPEPTDVIIFANPKTSGRLVKSILIGEYRDRAYRIKKDLLQEWGGISANNGYIQRSAVPPKFNDPEKFLKWFKKYNVELVKRNN